ncbi:lysylphosphatidylglycerol synthase transmembrane domain-containing protein [Schaalia vaccimaxillae]|uniref:lysylphosphatidylglycerol synthase transmembrane domain-containing protein n=1 Tax=Schaalia vaccimaxillae TaxID=183916 RepID=UPI0003B780AE|nr:lysylphosphatidylglycerol synthase transmembrane domain-containing protein [Schaalia vaccimaxillae]
MEMREDEDAAREAGISRAAAEKALSPSLPTKKRMPRLTRSVHFADRATPRQRRREDLVDIIVALLGIVAVWVVGVFANATTQGVTEDVLRFQVIREVLLLPVTLIEGMVVLIAPIGIVVALALRRRLQTITHAISTAIVAALGGWGILALVALLPESITAPLRVATAVAGQSGNTDTAIGINLVIVTLTALFTTAGEIQNMRTVRWSWIGLWVILFLGVMRSSMTLPGAFISVLIGRIFGSAARWIFGFQDRRADGVDIVEGLLSIGVTPSRIIRADLDTEDEPLTTWSIDEDEDGQLRQSSGPMDSVDYTVTRRPDPDGNRHYQAWDHSGIGLEVTVLDPGRELTGTLVEVWNNIRLRGISRWISPSVKASAERSTLTILTARRGGVRTPEPVGIAQAGDSVLSVSRALPASTPLHSVDAEVVTDDMLTQAWDQLLSAHQQGVAHRNLSFDSVLVDANQQVWIVDWERGEVATTDLNHRIDIAQMLVLQASTVGAERALEMARRSLPEERLASCAPVLQGPVLPFSVNQSLRRTSLLEDLRADLVADEESSGATQPANLQRFRPRTLLTSAILFVALVVVLGSMNFEDIIAAVTHANPVWLAASFGLACLTWAGSAIPLMALSTEKLKFSESLIAQVAASIITIVAPAGVGPAALNMRFLKKKKMSTAMSVTTVTMQQISQVVITVILLLLVMVVSGSSLSVSLPYGTILAVVIVVAIGTGVALAVPKIRRWIIAKVLPTWQQIYPRLLWIVGQPRRIAAVVGGNLVMNIGYIGCFWAALEAMGGSMSLSNLAITYLASNTLGSVIPSPGGIGPVETALTAGLQVAGIPLSIGLPTAIIYRLMTFYGRIPFGWVAMKYMEKRDLI